MGELSEYRKRGCVETFNANGPLRQHFPVTLANGTTVHKVDGLCGSCGGVIDPERVHGRVSRPLETVAVVDAAGYCEACSFITELTLRLRVVGSTYQAEALSRDGWRKAMPLPPTLWHRLRRWLVKMVAR